MKKAIFLILIIIVFLLIDFFTGFLVFLDCLADRRTIKVESQEDFIIQEIKEHFDIDYNITKITFISGIPDGYYLDIYDENNQVKGVFEDNHEDSKIYDYFEDVKTDIPQHLIYLIIELVIEFIIIRVLIKKEKYQEN